MGTLNFLLPSGSPVEIQESAAEAERVLDNKPYLKSDKWLNKFMVKALASLDDKPVPKNEGKAISEIMKAGNNLKVDINLMTTDITQL